jgi:hypothetical protein
MQIRNQPTKPACTPVLSCLHLSVTQAQVRFLTKAAREV